MLVVRGRLGLLMLTWCESGRFARATESHPGIDRRRRPPGGAKISDQLRKAPWCVDLRRCGELIGRPPAQVGDELGTELIKAQHRHRLEVRHLHQEEALDLAIPATVEEGNDVRARPDARTDVVDLEAHLLEQLAAKRVLVRFTGLQPAARTGPHVAIGKLEPNEEDASVRIQHHRASGIAQSEGRAHRGC